MNFENMSMCYKCKELKPGFVPDVVAPPAPVTGVSKSPPEPPAPVSGVAKSEAEKNKKKKKDMIKKNKLEPLLRRSGLRCKMLPAVGMRSLPS